MNLLTRFYDPSRGRDPARRRRPPRLQGRRPAQPVRDRAAGAGAVLDQHRREHRLRPPGRRAGRRSRRPRRPRTSTTSSSSLPEGYETQVGERGMRLSGGERQRISLARAFLKDAPILILDEPTSSVDVETEAVIMEAMERLMAGRTSFMIAHRLSTLEGCDLRLEIDKGRIVRPCTPAPPPTARTRMTASYRRRTRIVGPPCGHGMAVAGRREAAPGGGPEGEPVPQARRLPARGGRARWLARDRKGLQAKDRGGRERRLRGIASAPADAESSLLRKGAGRRQAALLAVSRGRRRRALFARGAGAPAPGRALARERSASCRRIPESCGSSRTGDRGTTWSTS